MNNDQTISVYDDIDWQLLWQQSRSQKSWKSKDAKQWDKKAESFAGRIRDSTYIDLFLSFLDLDKDIRVLDVGCGPGTLAIPLARQVKQVTAIDYSQGMLNILDQQAQQQGINNIRTINCAWEDDWSDFGITSHDIVIASRSMNIADLAGGLKKINDFAGRRVYVAERIAPSPFDPDAFAALGRPFSSGPDYIYTVNMLYQLGIHPRIDLIELARELRFVDMEQALNGHTWMFKDLSPEDELLLEKFLRDRIIKREKDNLIIRRNFPQRWALLSWTKQQTGKII